MRLAQPLRIAALLALIFAAGVVTGRLTAPRPPTLVAGPGGGVRTADMVLARLTAELGLDEAQQAQFKPVLEEMAERMARLPPGSAERRAVFRETVPRLRPWLRADQQAAFDRMVERTERRYQQLIQARPGGR